MSDILPACPICSKPLSVRLARGRKSGKSFIMLLCASDGRHFRGFITYRPFVEGMLAKLESLKQVNTGENK
jgi:hypothetical protein